MPRAGILPAYVEILLAVGDVVEARSASSELEGIAAASESAMLRAIASQVEGAVEPRGG